MSATLTIISLLITAYTILIFILNKEWVGIVPANLFIWDMLAACACFVHGERLAVGSGTQLPRRENEPKQKIDSFLMVIETPGHWTFPMAS